MSQIDRTLAEAARAWPFEEARKLVARIGGKAPAKGYVLLETGYISNDDDLALLLSNEYRRNIAIGVRKAIEIHFARRLAGE